MNSHGRGNRCWVIFPLVIAVGLTLVVGAAAATYTIGPGDIVEVNVFQNDDLDIISEVPQSGDVFMPLIGEIHVSGLTRDEAAELIEQKLATGYVNNPSVVFNVRSYAGRSVRVLGLIPNPGVYELEPNVCLLEVLAQAGGFEDDAARTEVKLLRNGEEPILIDFEKLLKTGDLSQNVFLQDGDAIIVPDKKDYGVLVLGEVMRPDRYGYHRRLTVLEALAKAGGRTRRGNIKAVRVVRRDPADGQLHVLKVNLRNIYYGKREEENIVLEPGDIVFVPPTFWSKFDDFIGHLLPALQTAVTGEGIVTTVYQWRYYDAVYDELQNR